MILSVSSHEWYFLAGRLNSLGRTSKKVGPVQGEGIIVAQLSRRALPMV